MGVAVQHAVARIPFVYLCGRQHSRANHMIKKITFVSVSMLLLTGLARWTTVGGQTRDSCPPSADNELVEAVFRYQLAESVQAERWEVFYLAFGLNASGEECV